MSLYRQSGGVSHRILAAAVAGTLVVAGIGGYALGSSGGDDAPSLNAQIATLRADMSPAGDAIEVLRTEYPQAVGGSPDELVGAKGDVQRVEELVNAHLEDLEALDAKGTVALKAAVDTLAQAVAAREPVRQVGAKADAVVAALETVLPR